MAHSETLIKQDTMMKVSRILAALAVILATALSGCATDDGAYNSSPASTSRPSRGGGY